MIPFGMWTRVSARKHALDGGAHCRHLANTIEPSVCVSDVAFLSNYFVQCKNWQQFICKELPLLHSVVANLFSLQFSWSINQEWYWMETEWKMVLFLESVVLDKIRTVPFINYNIFILKHVVGKWHTNTSITEQQITLTFSGWPFVLLCYKVDKWYRLGVSEFCAKKWKFCARNLQI